MKHKINSCTDCPFFDDRSDEYLRYCMHPDYSFSFKEKFDCDKFVHKDCELLKNPIVEFEIKDDKIKDYNVQLNFREVCPKCGKFIDSCYQFASLKNIVRNFNIEFYCDHCLEKFKKIFSERGENFR